MVPHILYKTEAKSVPVSFFHVGPSLKWYVASMDMTPLLGCLCNNTSSHWWIERGVKIYMDDWISWYIIHHPRQVDQDFAGSASKPPHHPQGCGGLYDMYSRPWIGCHAFHISCGEISKVSHAWDVTYIQGCPPSRPQTTIYAGRGFVGFLNHQIIPRVVWVVIQGTSSHG